MATDERWYPTPVWWVDADVCTIDVAPAGAVAGDGTVNDGNVALILSGDSSFAVEGTREEVRQLIAACALALDVQELKTKESR